jgi:peroxiredoxin
LEVKGIEMQMQQVQIQRKNIIVRVDLSFTPKAWTDYCYAASVAYGEKIRTVKEARGNLEHAAWEGVERHLDVLDIDLTDGYIDCPA